MRAFRMYRKEDVTGVSGTGHVADIIQIGKIYIVKWTTPISSTVIYNSLEDILKIHGHDGKTTLHQLQILQCESCKYTFDEDFFEYKRILGHEKNICVQCVCEGCAFIEAEPKEEYTHYKGVFFNLPQQER